MKTSEGLRLKAYRCTAGKWTIGYGHAETNPRPVRGLLNGEFYEGKVCEGLSIKQAEADRLFEEDCDEIERGMSRHITAELSQPQFDGLFSWTFNFNPDKFAGSTMLRRVNLNPNSPGVLDAMVEWIHVGGIKTEDMYRRRCRDACLYAGVPIPRELWIEDGIPFVTTGPERDSKIDFSATPTVHQVIAGKLAPTPPRVSPNVADVVVQPWPKEQPPTVAKKPDPIVTVIVDKPPEQARSSAPVAVEPPAKPPPAAPPSVPPPAPPVAVPPVVKAEEKPAPPVIQAKTVDLKAIPYGEIDTANPQVKNATDSRRILGMILVGLGSFVQALITRGIVTSTWAALFYDLSRDPIVIALAAGACIWLASEVAKRTGRAKITTGMVEATTLIK